VKAEAATQASKSQALTKGACPICGILKDFQWTLISGGQHAHSGTW
jgi:hypothetical protein